MAIIVEKRRRIRDAFGTAKEYVRTFLVDTGDADVALVDPALPDKGDFYPGSTSLRARSREIEELTDEVCEVRITYGVTSPGGPSEREPGDIEEQVDVEVEYERIFKDVDDNPLDHLAEGVWIRRPRMVYRVVRWQGVLGITALLNAVGRVNDRKFLGRAKHTWLMEPPSSHRTNFGLWRVELAFTHNPDTWKHKFPDEEGADQEREVYEETNLNKFLT